MDVIAHTLWTNAVFHAKYHNDRKNRYWAAFFGVLPDLVGFTPAFFYMLFSGVGFRPGLFSSNVWVFRFAAEAYNYTHSLVIFALAFMLVTAVRGGKVYWPMFGWALHVLIDIPTHRNFYETPFLHPISNYRFSHGISWGHPIFMFINYLALFSVYFFFFLRKKQFYGRKDAK